LSSVDISENEYTTSVSVFTFFVILEKMYLNELKNNYLKDIITN